MKQLKLDQALIPLGDWERLQAVLPQTEIKYDGANAGYTKQVQTAAA